ncbi:MAG: NADH-quinone oxidoreductase subunit J [Rubrobacteridae bacterium]|nr:NADH-quinone oxidoreductase subunit J [Rubrobacteridae bacterium]
METINLIIFSILAVFTIVSALFVIEERNLFHSALMLGAYLLSLAGLYFLLDADLVGIMQVFVYVGGVMVVLLFGIMLTSQIINVRLVSGLQQRLSADIAVVVLVVLIAVILTKTTFTISTIPSVKNTLPLVGKLFMTKYVLPFEVISILLLAALIGAIVIARGEDKA